MTNYNDGKWYGWNGGECPVHPESIVEVRWQSDFATQRDQAGSISGAGQWTWEGQSNRIVAFRVVEEYKEPREFWINPKTKLVTSPYDPQSIHVREVLE